MATFQIKGVEYFTIFCIDVGISVLQYYMIRLLYAIAATIYSAFTKRVWFYYFHDGIVFIRFSNIEFKRQIINIYNQSL